MMVGLTNSLFLGKLSANEGWATINEEGALIEFYPILLTSHRVKPWLIGFNTGSVLRRHRWRTFWAQLV